MNGFKFSLNDYVEIEVSEARGFVIARAEYATSENTYFLRMCAADGRACEQWWGESALCAVPPLAVPPIAGMGERP